MLDIVAGVEKALTLTIELNSMRGLVDTISPFKVLLRTSSKLTLSSVDNLMQVVHLTEAALGEADGH